MTDQQLYREYRNNGKLAYEGGISQGKFCGQGKAYYPDGTLMYEGEFYGVQHGQGRLYYENGHLMYEGGFKFGRAHGEGVLMGEDGSLLYRGTFRDGRPVMSSRSFANGEYYH